MTYFSTTTGVDIPAYTVILEDVKTRMRAKWGENIAVDDPDSNMGRQAALMAELVSDTLQDQATTVSGLLPSTSVGALLSELVKFNGITRNESVYSTGIVSCTAGTTGSTIPAGSLIGTTDGTQVATDTELVLIAGETADVNVTATVEGALIAEAGTLTEILTPTYGWVSVTNATALTPGRSDETDPALRSRRWRKALGVGSHHVSAIKGAIEDITGVTACNVEIDTSLDNPVRVIVRDGADQDIANVLFGVGTGYGSAAAGCGTRGATAVECTADGQTGYVYFDRASDINIYVAVRTRKTSLYPSNGDALMRGYIIDLFNGDLEVNDVAVPPFGLGDDVYATRIMTACNAVPGHYVTAVYVGRTASPTATFVEMDSDEVAVTASGLISITGV